MLLCLYILFGFDGDYIANLLWALNNIHLFARHICGKTNVLADSLSRYNLADTYAAYLQHPVTSLDLFPDDSMFAFTAY